jgi:hypothetical protein
MNSLMVRMAELVTLIIYNEAHGIIIYLDGDIPLEASHIACASSSLAPHHKLRGVGMGNRWFFLCWQHSHPPRTNLTRRRGYVFSRRN